MPTMTSKRLGDLEAEREIFILHEQQIIQEREEILMNVRSHLDQLDTEIVRLGGTAREIPNQGQCAALLYSGEKNVFVPSVAPFPPVKRNWNTGKKPCVRPRKPEDGCGPSTDEKIAGPSRRKRGRPRKERVPSQVLVSGKESAPSNASSLNKNNQSVSPFNEPQKKGICPSKKFLDATPTAAKRGNSDSVQVASAYGKDSKSSEGIESNGAKGAGGEPWTCECGERLAATRHRCGKCRKWRGGRRATRWSLGSTTAASSSAKAISATRKAATAPPCSIIEVYMSLPTTRPKPGVDGGALVLGSDDYAAGVDPRFEIEAAVAQMVTAVAAAGFLGETKSRCLDKKSTATDKGGESGGVQKSPEQEETGEAKKSNKNDEMKEGGKSEERTEAKKDGESGKEDASCPAPIKRKRGRPRKNTHTTRMEPIQRVVSTSDSDSATEASYKPALPKKNLPKKGGQLCEDQSGVAAEQQAEVRVLKNAAAPEESLEQDEMNNFSMEQAKSVVGGFVKYII